jgi:hypothetical protein
MTISLWDSRDNLDAVETRATRVREEAAQSIGTAAPPPVDIYQVEFADQADRPI